MSRKTVPTVLDIREANTDLLSKKFGNWVPTQVCWACMIPCESLERAHKVPRVLGGSFEPNNFYLLCSFCHEEQPDCEEVEIQNLWLLRHENWFEPYRRILASDPSPYQIKHEALIRVISGEEPLSPTASGYISSKRYWNLFQAAFHKVVRKIMSSKKLTRSAMRNWSWSGSIKSH